MTIKKIFITGMVLVLTSCSKLDLNPLSEPSNENWFTDQTQVQMSLNTLFLHQFWPIAKSETPGATAAFDEFSDDWTNRGTLLPFTNGQLNSETATVEGIWGYTYKAIARCNTILQYISKSKDNLSPELYERYVGVARFVRACQYSRIITLFGDVVYLDSEIDIDQALKLGRTDKNEVLKHIYEDFNYAIDKLPVSYSGSEIQYPAKGAAYAMKARIALYMSDWATARDAAKACIDLDQYQLYPDFGELFLTKTKNSVETVFGIPRSVELGVKLSGGNITAYLPRTMGGTSTGNPSWDLFCAYLCKDGLPIDESPLYNPRNPFLNRDPRCTSTIVEFNTRFLGFNYTPHPDSAKVWSYIQADKITNKDSKASDQYASYNGLLLKKGIDEAWTDDLESDPDKMIMRYADVLLMYAEAKIELNDIDQSVLDAINQVRSRAYKVSYTETNRYPVVTVTNQAALRRILRVERRMEFAFEGLRYYDILRWRLAGKVMNRPNYGLLSSVGDLRTKLVKANMWFFPGTPDIDEDGTPDFSKMPNSSLIRVLSRRVFDESRNYLWPVPNADIVINPNLRQNPGY